MELSWSDYIKAYWPFAVLIAINVVGGIYSAGFAAGQKSIMQAALDSKKAATNGW